jgi:uncharacterized membrane protein YhaH (DUF805 family)
VAADPALLVVVLLVVVLLAVVLLALVLLALVAVLVPEAPLQHRRLRSLQTSASPAGSSWASARPVLSRT